MGSKKITVYRNGQVAEPFRPHKAEDGKVPAVWFYAGRGKFEFVVQGTKDGRWLDPMQFSISTRMIRKAIRLVDSAKPRAAKD